LLFAALSSEAITKHKLRATKYYPTGRATASGATPDYKKINDGTIRWVALSRDMFEKGYKMGDTIFVESDNPRVVGFWVVKDKMGPSHRDAIDFLMTRENSKEFGLGYVTVAKKIKAGSEIEVAEAVAPKPAMVDTVPVETVYVTRDNPTPPAPQPVVAKEKAPVPDASNRIKVKVVLIEYDGDADKLGGVIDKISSAMRGKEPEPTDE
jgi:3D (Asp-Asp-Asp) domain-containing protein